MERFCGHLLPAVKSAVRPYENLDNYVQRRAQMQIVSIVYDMPSLRRPKINYTYLHGERLSSREKMYPDCKQHRRHHPPVHSLTNGIRSVPEIILGPPVKHNVDVNVRLLNEFTKYFGVTYGQGLRGQQLRDRIDLTTLVSYGRFRLIDDADRMRVARLIERDASARDNSFIKARPLHTHLYTYIPVLTNLHC